MYRYLLLAAAFAATLAACRPHGAPLEVIAEPMTYSEAVAACEARGGSLARLVDEADAEASCDSSGLRTPDGYAWPCWLGAAEGNPVPAVPMLWYGDRYDPQLAQVEGQGWTAVPVCTMPGGGR